MNNCFWYHIKTSWEAEDKIKTRLWEYGSFIILAVGYKWDWRPTSRVLVEQIFKPIEHKTYIINAWWDIFRRYQLVAQVLAKRAQMVKCVYLALWQEIVHFFVTQVLFTFIQTSFLKLVIGQKFNQYNI